MTSPESIRRGRGFTLVELMVAMAITVALSSVIMTTAVFSMDIWARGRSEVRASRQAKSMAESIARDIESMVVRKGNDFQWLSAETMIPDSGPKGVHRSGNAARLAFFSSATDRYDGKTGSADTGQGGDVSTVVYELQYKDPTGAAGNGEYSNFVLYRRLIDPDDTFKDLLCQTDLGGALDSYSGSVGDFGNFVCENLYQFTLTFHVAVPESREEGSRILQIPVKVGDGGGAGFVGSFKIFGNRIETALPRGADVTADQLEAGKLSGLEISLTVLTDAGLRQMHQRPFRTTADESDFLRKHSFQYSKLVRISTD